MKASDAVQVDTIQDAERATFRCLFDEDFGDRLALVRCYLDGEPTTTVCLVDRNPIDGDYFMTPLYVGITDKMDLRGPDGERMHPMIQN